MSNNAFSLVSGSCNAATRCSIFNAWFDEEVVLLLLFALLLICCCCCCCCCAAAAAACAAIIISLSRARVGSVFTNRPIDDSKLLLRRCAASIVSNKYRNRPSSGTFLETKDVYRDERTNEKESRSLCCSLSVALCRGKVFFDARGEITFFGETFVKKKRVVLCCFRLAHTDGGTHEQRVVKA